tara:strand:- start:15471 stop:16022 length:552 start_codon:yes stop_codon:yes gene_type:complete
MKLVRLAAFIGLQSILATGVWAGLHSDASAHEHGHSGSMSAKSGMVEKMPTANNVVADSCWLRLLPSSAPSAGYFSLRNDRQDDIVIVGAAAKAFDEVMVHQTTQENGMSRMAMVPEIHVGPGQELVFEPGSYHLMLEKPNRQVQVGDTVEVSVALKSGEKVAVSCEIKPAATTHHHGAASPH